MPRTYSPNFDFWLVVSLYDLPQSWHARSSRTAVSTYLRREVLQRQCRGKGRTHGGEIWTEDVGLWFRGSASRSQLWGLFTDHGKEVVSEPADEMV